jgi:hypothetical protein
VVGALLKLMAELPSSLPEAPSREWLCRVFIPRLVQAQRVGTDLLVELLSRAARLLEPTPNVALLPDLQVPCLVVGPLRGHLDAARHVAGALAKHPLASVVFLGDYVDGGSFSAETLAVAAATLCALGPSRVALLRGRHEAFYPAPYRWTGSEARLDQALLARGDWAANGAADSALRAFFRSLQLCAVVHGRYFCCSGGPTPACATVAEINALDRTAAVGTAAAAPVVDIVASEPADEDEESLAAKEDVAFARNPEIGFGAVYTFAAACRFLQQNDLTSIVRGALMPLSADPPLVSLACRTSTGRYSPHDPGFRFLRSTPIGSPSTITLFSAPRLAGRAHNLGAVLWIKSGLAAVHQFEADLARGVQLPGPNGGRTAFDWSFDLMVRHLSDALQMMVADRSTPAEKREEYEAAENHDEAVRRAQIARFRRLCKHQKKNGDLADLAAVHRAGAAD